MRFRLSRLRGFGHTSGDWGGKDPIRTKPRTRPGSGTPITRRELGALAAGTMALSGELAAQTVGADPSHPGPILDLAEWSYRWYGVEHATLARGTVCNGMQMYVEHWIPARARHAYPVVLIHGGYLQGSIWISTPDGRRGWAIQLVEQGYKVYLVDRPGQGRNPYHPWVHGAFDREAPTFERAAAEIAGTQWPAKVHVNDPTIAQVTAALGQPMVANAITQNLWRMRGALLLDEIGPAWLVTHADGALFACFAAGERPGLVKGIVAVEPPAEALRGLGAQGLAKLIDIPIALVSGEASGRNLAPVATAFRQAGSTVEEIRLADHGVHGNSTLVMMENNNREALAPIVAWMETAVPEGAPGARTTSDPHPNRESTALELADQGCFWVGVERKPMPYGTIALGQMFVQYMIPAKPRYPYPVVMVHGGGGQGTHMMGIGGRPGWVHYFVQAGYRVYWVDRPSYGRSPYHPDALGPSHLPNVPPMEGLVTSTGVFNTAQWPGPGGMTDPLVDQFMASESGNVTDEAFHSALVWPGGAELLDRIGPSILLVHAFGGFFAWGVADRRPHLVKGILCVEINGNPFAGQLRWGLTAAPMTYDPPLTDSAEFQLVDHTEPPDSPRPIVASYKLQAEPARKWKNLQGIPIGWLTSEFGAGGSPVANVEFLRQVGCPVELLRLRDYGISGNGNLMLLEKNNHEVFGVIRGWLDRKVAAPARS
jgi:pimeloyl-ACP methyl ester carboxylesterase